MQLEKMEVLVLPSIGKRSLRARYGNEKISQIGFLFILKLYFKLGANFTSCPFFTELAPRIFYKLQNLKELDLSGNRLQRFDGAIFADIPNLEVFSCTKCALVEVSHLTH